MDQQKREEWDEMLNAPLPNADPTRPTEAQVEREGADFMAAMMQHQQLAGG